MGSRTRARFFNLDPDCETCRDIARTRSKTIVFRPQQIMVDVHLRDTFLRHPHLMSEFPEDYGPVLAAKRRISQLERSG